jgi:hypothetical protein
MSVHRTVLNLTFPSSLEYIIIKIAFKIVVSLIQICNPQFLYERSKRKITFLEVLLPFSSELCILMSVV